MKTFLLLSSLAVAANAFTLNLPLHTSPPFSYSIKRSVIKLCSTTQNENDYDNSSGNIPLSRRSALSKSTQSLAAIFLANSIIPTDPALADIQYPFTSPKTIIMTGSNSGIGYDAAKRMAKQGHQIILACRTFSKANDAATKMQEELNDPQLKLIPRECNLADLDSVRNFVDGLVKDGDIKKIDAICLNAGIARNTGTKDVLRTAQGFELTIGTNHLGHFLLTNEILNKSLLKDGGNIVVTASGVHDPDSPGGAQGSLATLGALQGMEKAVASSEAFGVFDMVDGGDFDADKAYKDSKLCNVFFMKELQQRLNKANKGIEVNAFNPGLIVSTGLFRDQNPIFTKLFNFAATDLLKVGENVHWGGGALEYMTLDSSVGSKGGLYYTSSPGSSKYGDKAYGNQFVVAQTSKETTDDAKGKRFWELSEKLVGI